MPVISSEIVRDSCGPAAMHTICHVLRLRGSCRMEFFGGTGRLTDLLRAMSADARADSQPPAGGDPGIALEEGCQGFETYPSASLSMFGKGDILRGDGIPAKERKSLRHRHDEIFGRDSLCPSFKSPVFHALDRLALVGIPFLL